MKHHKCSDDHCFVTKDFFSGELFRIYFCEKCSHGKTFVSDNFNPEDYYPPAIYSIESKNKFIFPFSWVYKFFRSKRAKIFTKNFPDKKTRLLDIGCGNGSFLYWVKESGYQHIYGTELSDLSSGYAKAVIGNEHIFSGIKEVQKVAKCFDCVTFWHTLEHFEDDHQILQSAYDVLTDGGTILIEVPNFCSLQAMIDRRHWVYNEAPRHIQHYSPHSLVSRLDELGFSVNKIKTFSAEFGFFGMFSSLCNLVGGKNIPLKIMLRQYHDISALHLFWFLLISPFALVVSVPLELLAVFLGYGGVVNLSASKTKYGRSW